MLQMTTNDITIKSNGDEKTYYVYRHVSPDGKIYIGVTSKKNPNGRWVNGHGYQYNDHFWRAIQKYGWENFDHDILFEGLTRDEAYAKEIEFIAYYNSTDPKCGYNNDKGGHGAETNRTTREETRRKRSQSMMGKNIGMNKWGGSARARRINQYTLDGEYIKTWDSSTQIRDTLGFDYTGIIRCCLFKRLSCKNYLWLYEEDSDRINEAVKRYKEPKILSELQKQHISESMLKYRAEEREQKLRNRRLF